jgi:hypothetical protein
MRQIVQFDRLCHHVHATDDDGSSNVEWRTEYYELFRYLKCQLPVIVDTKEIKKRIRKGQYLVGVSTSAKIP